MPIYLLRAQQWRFRDKGLLAGERVPIGVSMRKRLSKKYKPTRVHKRWQKLNDFQDTGLNNVY